MGPNEDREQRIHDAKMERLAREEADKAKLVAELDQAVKDGNRLADALVKSREEVANLNLQNSELKAKLVAALCRCGSPGEVSLSLHVPSCEYWKAMEKPKYEGIPDTFWASGCQIHHVVDCQACAEKPLCGLNKPMGIGETCTLDVGHRGPCDHTKKRVKQSPKKCADCGHDDVNLGWCHEVEHRQLEEAHCLKCCASPSHWEKA